MTYAQGCANTLCVTKTTERAASAIPRWDLPDRLRKTLRHADVSVQEMADYLEVNRNTISGWINGRHRPGAAAVKLWALRCGVPYEWLAHGIHPREGHGSELKEWAARDSNPEPTGPGTRELAGMFDRVQLRRSMGYTGDIRERASVRSRNGRLA